MPVLIGGTMRDLLVASLIMCLILVLLALSLNKYTAFWYKVMVNDRFDMINTIMTTEEVPAKWRIKILDSLVRKNKGSSFWRIIAALLMKWYIFRLGRLIKSIKASSLIKDQDKLEYIDAFKEIQSAWSSSLDQ
jgi:hypothetical protein